MKFLNTIADVFLYLMHKKIEYLHVFGVWHRKWKFWVRNHNVYSSVSQPLWDRGPV